MSLGKLKAFFKSISSNVQRSLDCPAELNDPVAQQTKWTPLKSGGTSFCTHKLSEVPPYRIEFRAALGAKLFYLLFLVLGIGVLTAFSRRLIPDSKQLSVANIIVLSVVGFVFAATGASLFYSQTKPIVFDKSNGYFWKGRKEPEFVLNINTDPIKVCAKLEQIYAIQLIREYCRAKHSFYSYELNLVLVNSERINVVDHGNIKQLRSDADKLSAFLEKPVWDFV